MYYLYQKKADTEILPFENDFVESCELEVFIPSFFKLQARGEKLGFKAIIARLIFLMMTKGNIKIYLLKKNGEIVHSSSVISKCGKFPFMSECDLEIGPCSTKKEYRHRGCYLYVLQKILSRENTFDDRNFYMIVNVHNYASIGGVEKAGFKRIGKVKKKLERYEETK